MPVALPGTQEFDDEAVASRQAQIAARQPRRTLAGGALILAALVAVVAYAWSAVRPGVGALSVDDAVGILRDLPYAAPIMATLCAAAAIIGTRLAVPRDAAHLSRAWIGGALVAFVVATAFVGTYVLAPVKWARSTHPVAAAEREIEARRLAAPTPFCSAPVDPSAFTEWVDAPEVCGSSVPSYRQLMIVGPPVNASMWSAPRRGLIYSPGHHPFASGGCVRQLDDDWWEYSSLIGGVSCPSGMDFEPIG
jgi:hypothetical protein